MEHSKCLVHAENHETRTGRHVRHVDAMLQGIPELEFPISGSRAEANPHTKDSLKC